MRSDKLLRSYRAAASLAATLIWIKSTRPSRAAPRKGPGYPAASRRSASSVSSVAPSGSTLSSNTASGEWL